MILHGEVHTKRSLRDPSSRLVSDVVNSQLSGVVLTAQPWPSPAGNASSRSRPLSIFNQKGGL